MSATTPTTSKRTLFIAGALLVGAIVAGITAVANFTQAKKPDAVAMGTAPGSARKTSAALTVTLARAMPMRWQDTLSASGDIAPWQEAMVSAEVGGLRLADVRVDVGDQVKKGELLARFDDSMVRAALLQQQAALREAEARLAEAQSKAERAEQLRRKGALSEQDLIAASTMAATAQAQVESAKARLQSQQLQLEDAQVVAPDDGVISARNAMLGSVANMGYELFRLVRQNRLEWRAKLTAEQLSLVRTGMKANVQLPDGQLVGGEVRQVAPTLESATRTGIAYIALPPDKTPPSARAGMYTAGTIELGDRPGLALPAGSVVLRDGRDYVFIVGAEQRVALTPVVIGRRRGTEIEVISGVSPEQSVVASGGAFLNDGDVVRVTAVDAARGTSS